ncbi:hypothetical protein ACFFIS_07260 [Virgibacillus soli]|uniref:Uncharacterized protein n=1 Tax=Paracerasibacillus soli TaxID=480284 RepID=A0ABU5CN08_9BACI|nr:hypothetical protein [Virgibacillus soli]MDY0407747.1 hypothetical protein [Virgibacillus soli]
MENKNKRLINIANIFTIFAFIYLIYAIGDIAYRYIALLSENSDINMNQMFKWNWDSFLREVTTSGFKVLVLFGIGAILRK